MSRWGSGRSWKETGIRLALLLVGLTIAHLGVTLFLLADLGADPFNVLVQGVWRSLTEKLGLTHGNTHIAMCFLIILVLLVVDRSYIKIGTVVCMMFGGPVIDLFTWMLTPLFQGVEALAIRIAVNGLGCVILAFGMTIVIRSDAGTGPNDLVAVLLSDKTRRPFGIVRVVVDVAFVAVGYLLGGAVGLGTVICAFLVGPVAGRFLPVSGKLVEKTLEKLLPANV